MDIIEELNFSNLITITSLFLGIMAFIIVIGIISGANSAYYNFRVGLVMYFLLLTMTACLLLYNLKRKKVAYLTIGVFLSSLILVIISPFENLYVDATIPVIFFSGFASITKIKEAIKAESLKEKIKNVAPHIIHFSVVILIVGILLSSVYVSNDAHTFTDQDREWEWHDYTIKYIGYQQEELGYGEVHNFNFEVLKNGDFIDEITITGVNKPGSETSFRPALHSGITEDLYLNFRSSTTEGVSINAQISPMMNLLWIGVALLATGITLRIITPIFAKNKRTKKGNLEQPKDNEFYDKKIEEELKKFKEEEKS